ncbi:MAG: hypothetical protein CMF60_03185 [Magnetococcales bacterium]|nr:hypothetical protein [Magnetococcales bacterium]|tara:strand:- start:4237 stop:4617 length:381 start_codon:yes stop_codon:yes gene_type:complete
MTPSEHKDPKRLLALTQARIAQEQLKLEETAEAIYQEVINKLKATHPFNLQSKKRVDGQSAYIPADTFIFFQMLQPAQNIHEALTQRSITLMAHQIVQERLQFDGWYVDFYYHDLHKTHLMQIAYP